VTAKRKLTWLLNVWKFMAASLVAIEGKRRAQRERTDHPRVSERTRVTPWTDRSGPEPERRARGERGEYPSCAPRRAKHGVQARKEGTEAHHCGDEEADRGDDEVAETGGIAPALKVVSSRISITCGLAVREFL